MLFSLSSQKLLHYIECGVVDLFRGPRDYDNNKMKQEFRIVVIILFVRAATTVSSLLSTLFYLLLPNNIAQGRPSASSSARRYRSLGEI
jgi:hypothetical protein